MKPVKRSAVLVSLGALLAVLLMGCGGDDAPEGSEGSADGAATAGSEASPDTADASGEQAATATECDPPDGLVERLGLQRQLVLNLAQAEGENLEAIQSSGPPEPETFRSVADILDSLDLSGIAANSPFEAPEDVVADLRKTADLLEAALAAGTDTADPAWRALTEFFTQEFFVQHNASVGYYLNEAGCV